MPRVKYLVVMDIYFLMRNAFPQVTWLTGWKKMVLLVEKCLHDIKIIPITWTRPLEQWVRLNSDGSTFTNGIIGVGGININHAGEFALAYASPIGIGSNNRVVVEATEFGIVWCIHMGFQNVILEVDLELVCRWVQRQSYPPWQVDQSMTRLQNYIAQLYSFKCIHIFREANYVVDSLSKFSHSIPAPKVFFEVQQFLRNAKTYYTLDKINMTAFKRKRLKRIKEPP